MLLRAREIFASRPICGITSSRCGFDDIRFMQKRNPDLHGSAPDKSEVALLIVDVINDLDFPEAKQMLRFVPAMARKLAKLKTRAKAAGVPVIYVNDNFGRWRSDFRKLVEHCRESHARELVDTLRPDEDDYFVLKPKHSGFFASALETLLRYLESRRLIVTGIAGNFCVLFTANDAYIRDYELLVPADCCISNTERENREALSLMKRFLKANVGESTCIKLPRKRKARRGRSSQRTGDRQATGGHSGVDDPVR